LLGYPTQPRQFLWLIELEIIELSGCWVWGAPENIIWLLTWFAHLSHQLGDCLSVSQLALAGIALRHSVANNISHCIMSHWDEQRRGWSWLGEYVANAVVIVLSF
jgi:hypothetical protein